MMKPVPNFAKSFSLLLALSVFVPTLTYAKLPGGTGTLTVNQSFTYGDGQQDQSKDPRYDKDNLGALNTQKSTTNYDWTSDSERGKDAGGTSSSFSVNSMLGDLILVFAGSVFGGSDQPGFGERLFGLILQDVVQPYGNQYGSSLTGTSGFGSLFASVIASSRSKKKGYSGDSYADNPFYCPTGTCTSTAENPYGKDVETLVDEAITKALQTYVAPAASSILPST